eukprot:3220104-Lingulodinium_polyedra.AAC.1
MTGRRPVGGRPAVPTARATTTWYPYLGPRAQPKHGLYVCGREPLNIRPLTTHHHYRRAPTDHGVRSAQPQ